ncbi:ribosomal-processing cysteine protease Prp [Brevibacillus sp. SYSU BS000544]|uniref:ribosomal-processing cysteine protease Prp n=1 Tax=Brevibacillus sp. SYSU BS000544 TaxID=3416443 RepID=UPI003CE48F1F
MDDINSFFDEIDFQREILGEDAYDPFVITFYLNNKGVLYGFTASGETGFMRYGLDIIAAGVSILIINTINSIRSLTNEIAEVELERNFAKCILPNAKRNKSCKEGVLLLESLKMGVYSIQESYGTKFVTIVEIQEERRKNLFHIFK